MGETRRCQERRKGSNESLFSLDRKVGDATTFRSRLNKNDVVLASSRLRKSKSNLVIEFDYTQAIATLSEEIKQMYKTLLSIASLAALSLAGCDRGAPPAAAPMMAPAVSTVAAVSRNVPAYLDEIGHTVASEAVTIEPQVSGRVMAVLFTDGAEIIKDQPLSPSIRDRSKRPSIKPRQASLNRRPHWSWPSQTTPASPD